MCKVCGKNAKINVEENHSLRDPNIVWYTRTCTECWTTLNDEQWAMLETEEGAELLESYRKPYRKELERKAKRNGS